MELFESRYYAKSKFLLETVGLWPYQSSTKRWIIFFLYHLLVLSGVIPMVLYLILRNDDFCKFTENLTSILCSLVSQWKHSITFANASRLRLLLSQISKHWKQIVDPEELKILKDLAEESRLISSFYIIGGYNSCLLFTGSPFVTMFLEKFFPLQNGSYPLLVPAWHEFILFDQFDHYFLCCLHGFFIFGCIVTMFGGTNSIYFCTVQHASALFSIVSHRMKNMFNSKDNTVNMIKLREAVELYNESVRCCCLLEDSFSICIFVVLMICTIAISGCSILIVTIDDTFVRMKTGGVLIGVIFEILYLNWVGQKVIDTSENVFYSVYFSDWYLMPKNIRKMIIIIMCRTLKPQELTAGKMITLSMYTFQKLMRTCTSVFAVFSCIKLRSDLN